MIEDARLVRANHFAGLGIAHVPHVTGEKNLGIRFQQPPNCLFLHCKATLTEYILICQIKIYLLALFEKRCEAMSVINAGCGKLAMIAARTNSLFVHRLSPYKEKVNMAADS